MKADNVVTACAHAAPLCIPRKTCCIALKDVCGLQANTKHSFLGHFQQQGGAGYQVNTELDAYEGELSLLNQTAHLGTVVLHYKGGVYSPL